MFETQHFSANAIRNISDTLKSQEKKLNALNELFVRKNQKLIYDKLQESSGSYNKYTPSNITGRSKSRTKRREERLTRLESRRDGVALRNRDPLGNTHFPDRKHNLNRDPLSEEYSDIVKNIPSDTPVELSDQSLIQGESMLLNANYNKRHLSDSPHDNTITPSKIPTPPTTSSDEIVLLTDSSLREPERKAFSSNTQSGSGLNALNGLCPSGSRSELNAPTFDSDLIRMLKPFVFFKGVYMADQLRGFLNNHLHDPRKLGYYTQ